MAADNTSKPPKRRVWEIIPKQRPKEEWEHVYVTRSGVRYVEVEELFARESVKEDLAKMQKLWESHTKNHPE